jgi:5'(3')-deoxyribonucleotidase
VFQVAEVEADSEAYLKLMSCSELKKLIGEIEHGVATNTSFVTELAFWRSLKIKVTYKLAVKQITNIYNAFLKSNGAKIDKAIAEMKKNDSTKEEELKQSEADKQPVKVILSFAEKIKKTAINTGIRFNIVDNLGFDNSSLAMF